MATKVALTAEEFRENSQRSIALFNTEKLSTGSTQVLKSAYCNSVHFCRCNLHGACGGKGQRFQRGNGGARCNLHGACGGKDPQPEKPAAEGVLQSARGVWRQRESVGEENVRKDVAICTGRVEAKIAFPPQLVQLSVAICTRRVEAKSASLDHLLMVSAVAICTGRVEDLASSPEKNPRKFMQTYCIFIHLGV